MAAWVDLSTLHTPAAGTRPPASWGLGVDSNLDFLSGSAAAEVLTNQSTSSTSYTDLATAGPAVSVDTGTKAAVIIGTQFVSGGASASALVSVAVTGATTIAASDDQIMYSGDVNVMGFAVCSLLLFSTLTPGTNTFTMKYKVSANSVSFLRRRILVIPLR